MPGPDFNETVLLRLQALEQAVATIRSSVGVDRSDSDDTEKDLVLARLRALEEAVAAGRHEKDDC